ncbi:MAG: ABC transporter substrate-binding protein [Erysipelotrichaceae bacterium]|nr:ABC transporter substrate-binding protein [Erysipelotrichaceae bacterium]
MKKLTSMILAAAAAVSMTACSSGSPSGSNSNSGGEESDTYLVGICQLVQHVALDAATQGFMDELTAEFGDKVEFDQQNASGDPATCTMIANQFVSEKVDLMLANATPALQAAASATDSIPVLGTSITEYGVALGIDDFNGTVGTNVSGTSDLAPLGQQAEMFDELLPDAKNIGILYCSAEANSVYQAEEVKKALETLGKTVTVYTFSDSNDVASVTATACNENDALYIPTDNTAASSAEAISNVALPAGVPIIAGEEGLCKGCGIASLSIDYYELGRATGAMAVRVLKGEDISAMPIEYYQNPVKKYNAELCKELGITVPSDYTAIE